METALDQQAKALHDHVTSLVASLDKAWFSYNRAYVVAEIQRVQDNFSQWLDEQGIHHIEGFLEYLEQLEQDFVDWQIIHEQRSEQREVASLLATLSDNQIHPEHHFFARLQRELSEYTVEHNRLYDCCGRREIVFIISVSISLSMMLWWWEVPIPLSLICLVVLCSCFITLFRWTRTWRWIVGLLMMLTVGVRSYYILFVR